MAIVAYILFHVLFSLRLRINLTHVQEIKKTAPKTEYVLFLTGSEFEEDWLTPKMDKYCEKALKMKKKDYKSDEPFEPNENFKRLDRKGLLKVWGKCYKVYSVGSLSEEYTVPNETHFEGKIQENPIPEGTTRIYIEGDDASEKEDLKYLMEYAKYIIINTYPYGKSLWQIELANKLFPNKTLFYIDWVEYLNIFKEKLGPSLPKCLEQCHKDNSITNEEMDKILEELDWDNLDGLKALFFHRLAFQTPDGVYVIPYENIEDGLFETIIKVCETHNDPKYEKIKKKYLKHIQNKPIKQ